MKLAKLNSGTIVNLDMISSIEKVEQKDGRFTYCCHIGDMYLNFEEEEYANFSNYMDLDKVLTLKSLMINKKIEDIYKENRNRR